MTPSDDEGRLACGGCRLRATEAILERVAATYGGSITYEELAHRLFDETGYRTRMLLGQWIGNVLGPVQAATLTDGKPPLSSLVVRAATGGVGDGYVNHDHPATASPRSPSGSMPPRSTASRATAPTATTSPRTPDHR